MPRGRAIQHVGCKIGGCVHPHYGHGFCRLHMEWLRRGNIDESGNILVPVRQKGGRDCKVSGCTRAYASGGFCEYHRCQYRNGIIDIDGNSIRDLMCKPSLGKCKMEGCLNEDDAHGFCSRHYYQYREGILDKQGNQLKPLYDTLQSADPRSQHEKGVDFVMARYFNGEKFCVCPVCGGRFEFYQMDGHHPDRSKKTITPTKMLFYAFWKNAEMMKELDSLEWMCAHCHQTIEAGGDDIPYAVTNKYRVGKKVDVIISKILDIKGRKCMDCERALGRRTSIFHHRNPKQKTQNISQIIGRYAEKFVLEEADKCDILCEPCHRKRHRLDKTLRSTKESRNAMILLSPIGKKPKRDGKQGCKIVGCDRKHNARGFCHKHCSWLTAGIVDDSGNRLRPLYKSRFDKIRSHHSIALTMPASVQPPSIPEPNF